MSDHRCPTCQQRRLSWRYGQTDVDWQAEHDLQWHYDLKRGDAVTMRYPSDRLAYVAVSRTNHTVRLVLLPHPVHLGHEPVEYRGGFPVWSHTYSRAECEAAVAEAHRTGSPRGVTARRRADGCWYLAGTQVPLAYGGRYYRDTSE